MTMTTTERRTLPSVFSDVPSQNEVQRARKRIGELGGMIFLLAGAAVVFAAVASVAAYFYYQKNEELAVMRDAYETQNEQSTAFSELIRRRDGIQERRRALLDRLEGKQGSLSARQTQAAWAAAERNRLFDRAKARSENELSQAWTVSLGQTTSAISQEENDLTAAERLVAEAIVVNGGGGSPAAQRCPDDDPRRCPRNN